MDELEQLHQRGHHVQSAHGRRAVLAADTGDADHTDGCMIALMPTAADAKRLAVKGGESAAELHCTLAYLGPDASVFDGQMRGEMANAVRAMTEGAGPVHANVFGAAHWNGNTDTPSWVWSVGDDPASDSTCLGELHDLVSLVVDRVAEVPDQHAPWVAHICAAYSDDPTLLPELEKRLGPVEFDRIRLSFGDQDTDIPLQSGPVVAAAKADPANGVFRRRLTEVELASRFDFAGHQRGWNQAVDAALHDWAQSQAEWRNQIQAQLAAGKDVADLAVDTAAAAELLYRQMTQAAEAAGRAQQRAAEQQGVTVPPWSVGGASLTAALSGAAFLRRVAQITAGVVGDSVVDSAKRHAMRLLDVYSGVRLASEVDAFLRSLTDRVARDNIATAMTAAQSTGQRAVLEVAPKATYYASELLDDRCCDPCREVDGQAFGSLSEAEAAYPGGCFADCQGGGRCRGTIDAVWGDVLTAAGTEDQVTDQDLGARPSRGTRRDRRLKENAMTGDAPCSTCPDDADHFGSSQSVSDAPWNGEASAFTDAEYKEASAACDPGTQPPKERCFLPHHTPGGALSRAGLGAAAGRVGSLTGHDAAGVARAKAHLRAHYNAIGDPVPDSLKASARTAALAASCPDGWKPDPAGDGCVPVGWNRGMEAPVCPPGMVRDPDGDGCIDSSATAVPAAPIPPTPQLPMSATAPWEGVLAVEGVTTGDGREFAPDALTWSELPVPLRWNRVDSHGGEARTEAVNVGRIDSVERVGNQLRGTGVFDLSTEDGRTAHDKVKNQMLRGVSIDADSIGDAQIEFVWPADVSDGEDPDDIFAMLFAQPEKTIFHGGRIRAATLCDIPAFAEAYIALTDDTGAMVAGGVMERGEWEAAQPERPAVVAAAQTVLPQASDFADPLLSRPTPITSDGVRVWGHAGLWGTCHIGQTGTCVKPPRESEHAYYMTGEVTCRDGSVQAVGQITCGTGHAALSMGAQAAAEHYDHTGYAVADVAVGNDAHGIWVSGVIRPGADPDKVAALRAAGQVSGDWRRIGGQLRLVGLLAVNVPGFPVPRMRSLVSGGHQLALVAAGQITVAPGGYAEDHQAELRARMDALRGRLREKE